MIRVIGLAGGAALVVCLWFPYFGWSLLQGSPRGGQSLVLLTLFCGLGLAEAVMHVLAPEGAGREQGFVGHSTAVPYFVAKGDRWVPNRSEMSRYSSLPESRATGGLRVGVFGGSTVASNPPDGPVWQLAAMLKLGFGGDTHALQKGVCVL